VKNQVLIIVYGIIISSFVFLLILSKQKEKRQNVESGTQISHLPSLRYKIIKEGNYAPGMTKIVNIFDPDCDACQNMAERIVKDRKMFTNTHLLMLSLSDESKTLEFINKFQIEKLTFASIGYDTAKLFLNVFKPGSLPSYFIYNSEGILTDVIYGETSISRLLKRINE